MSATQRSSSLFDEIFRLQNPAPDVDADPEDEDNGLHASLVDGTAVDTEALGSTLLRKRTAIIDSDPKYQGKTTSRKNLYSDDEEFSDNNGDAIIGPGSSDASESIDEDSNDEEEKEDAENDADQSEDNENDEEDDESDVEDDEMDVSKQQEGAGVSVSVPSTKADDREKGKAVHQQLGIWDDLMRSRISLQKVVLACNQLPQPDAWPQFAQEDAFRTQARNVHSTVRKVVSALLDLQQLVGGQDGAAKSNTETGDSDGEITSESEGEEDEKAEKEEDKEEEEEMDEEDEEEEEMDQSLEKAKENGKRGKLKRKLAVEEVEEELASRYTGFQEFRNSTLSKWDEKTRLTHGKIRSKNFAAFEMSVLKQIEQVLVNRERLVRRIHQPRSALRVLGRPEEGEEGGKEEEQEVDDDEDEPEEPQHKKSEMKVDYEIVDDSDFYHVCLRDLLESKHSEELDPVTASRQRLEIQRLRNKQKKKVDTKASKGRKIRYHVKEKLKNYMTPYDKSSWSDQQKDDLFKAVFGGGLNTPKEEGGSNPQEMPTINIGL